MKKVLFLQIKGNSYGGVGFVNKVLAEALIDEKYEVEIMSIRDSHSGLNLGYDKRLKVSIVNKNDNWEITHFSDIIQSVKKFKIFSSIKMFFIMLKEKRKLKIDYKYVKKYIKENNFDYIITSHYQLLDTIPSDYLTKTIHVHHTAFRVGYNNRSNRKYFEKFKDKITFVWLTKTTCEEAKRHGYLNSYYIYNPVKFTSSKRADVVNNKKLVTIARISSEKRINLMVKIVNDVLKDKELNDWSFEIYGDGDCKKDILQTDYNKDKIKFMGVTADAKSVLLKSSINLNTSLYEGFAMGILEGNECGVPTVSFNFGESVSEEIINQKTGIYVDQDDIESYKKELKELMKDNDKLENMSVECKSFSENFQIKKIIEQWERLFSIVDMKKRNDRNEI